MDIRTTTFNCENLFSRYTLLDISPTQRKIGYENLIRLNEVVAIRPSRGNGVQSREIAELLHAAPELECYAPTKEK